jgi:NAD-dependent deacetylase
MSRPTYDEAARLIASARNIVAFTGAGISVESGIPTFRGPEGLWSHYNPQVLDIDWFHAHPEASWRVIKEIFYDYMGDRARPNAAHAFLSHLEERGQLSGIITQNIDHLHQSADSRHVVEFHGTAQQLECTACGRKHDYTASLLETLPPECPACGGLLKPDFVFFGEPIPPHAYEESLRLCHQADLLLIIGTTGEIMPASRLPYESDAPAIEINIAPSTYTTDRTNLFLQAKATEAARELEKRLG